MRCTRELSLQPQTGYSARHVAVRRGISADTQCGCSSRKQKGSLNVESHARPRRAGQLCSKSHYEIDPARVANDATVGIIGLRLGHMGGSFVHWEPARGRQPAIARFQFSTADERDRFVAKRWRFLASRRDAAIDMPVTCGKLSRALLAIEGVPLQSAHRSLARRSGSLRVSALQRLKIKQQRAAG